MVLRSTSAIVVTAIRPGKHFTPPHPLAQTSKQLRAEFKALYDEQYAKYATTIELHIDNFNCTGLDSAIKRLGLDPKDSGPDFELHIHLNNELPSGRKHFRQMIHTGGLFIQAPGGHLHIEKIDLLAEATKIVVVGNIQDLYKSRAVHCVYLWYQELTTRRITAEFLRFKKMWEGLKAMLDRTAAAAQEARVKGSVPWE